MYIVPLLIQNVTGIGNGVTTFAALNARLFVKNSHCPNQFEEVKFYGPVGARGETDRRCPEG